MPSSLLSTKGQIVIPKEVRDKLGLDAGDRVEFVEEPEGEYKIVPATGDIRRLKGAVPKPQQEVSVERMKEAVKKRAARSTKR